MNEGPQELVVFNLTLHLERLDDGQFRARAIHRVPGLTAGMTFWPDRVHLEDLLAQIERQYHDFQQAVAWAHESQDRRVSLGWRLDAQGRVVDGRAVLEDGVTRWTATAPLTGDQSFLPGIALGLQLALRD